MIAAPRSGSGKTLVTLAVLGALRRRGLAVRAAKSGPDYIDPGFHAACLGTPCLNLDSWAMPPALLDRLAADLSDAAPLLVVEAAMGLFDGVAGPAGQRGRPADIASRLGLPVLLVLDISGQSQSAAAVARGFALHEAGVRVAGVVLNRAASARHRDGAAAAIEAAGLPVLGCLLRDPALALPERHLGLVQAQEHAALAGFLDELASRAEAALDLDAILDVMAPLAIAGSRVPPALPPPGQRIALARDDAFSFLYPHVAQGWRDAGAEIVAFSPLADAAPPADCDCCWLPGGYPELHAGRLAQNSRFLDGLRRFAAMRPVHGECGGYMVLGETLEDADGVVHPMAALLGHATSFARRRLALGYREAFLVQETVLGPAGAILRGHEFHYARVTDAGSDRPLARLRDAAGHDLGDAGGVRGFVSGSFFHAIAAFPS
ncbi:cobyrinate a,c-diamide synthase [Lichenicoccus sp.]|uniref:cobyrinate a,c-diamide synthase n=1 Tax=Lichenicoccus sp. TaxID=2781899 RepID=UPI003D0B091A